MLYCKTLSLILTNSKTMNFLSLDLIYKPLYQLIFFVLLSVLFISFKKHNDANNIWYIAGLFYIGFILTNSALAWFAETGWGYFFISLAYSLLYILVVGIIISAFIHLFKLNGSGEAAMIFIYVIYHPILLLLVIGLKWVLSYVI